MRAAKRRANLRDVATAAGVSVATASRVINGTAKVSQATRARVEAAIETLNFVPSAAARAINSGRSRIVGALVPTLDHAIYARYLDALEQGLSTFGLSLIVATTDGNPAREYERARSLMDLGVEGYIATGVTHDPQFEALVKRYSIPVVITSYHDPDYHLPTVGYDNEAVGRMAMQHLLDAGYRDVAVLHGPLDDNDRTKARLAGAQSAASEALRLFECDLNFQSAGTATQTALAEVPRAPQALLCTSDVLAQGALFACQRLGVSVPDRLAIMGIDNLPGSAFVMPALTTVHLPVRQMGLKAAEALATWVEEGRRPDPVCLPAHVIERGTLLRGAPL